MQSISESGGARSEIWKQCLVVAILVVVLVPQCLASHEALPNANSEAVVSKVLDC